MKKTKLNLPTPRGTSAAVDLTRGTVYAAFEDTPAVASPLGVSVSHVYDPDYASQEFIVGTYGKGFRLNLDERIIPYAEFASEASAANKARFSAYDFIRIDPDGTCHGIEEHFVCTVANQPQYVDTTDVITDAAGNLSTIIDGITYPVKRILRTDDGWEYVTKLEDVQKLALLEQRSEDRAQLEEKKKAYKESLENYAFVKVTTGKLIDKIQDPSWSDYESCISAQEIFEQEPSENTTTEKSMLLPYNEAVNYRALLAQRRALTEQKKTLQTQKKNIATQIQALLLQKDSLNLQKQNTQLQYISNEQQYNAVGTQVAYDGLMQTLYAKLVTDENENISTSDARVGHVPRYETSSLKEEEWKNRLELGRLNEALIHNANVQNNLSGTVAIGLPTIPPPSGTVIPNQNGLLTKQNALIDKQDDLIGTLSDTKKNAVAAEVGTQTQLGLLYQQLEEIETQLNLLDGTVATGESTQMALCQEQIDALLEKASSQFENFKTLLLDYLHMETQLTNLYALEPVSYLKGKSGIKCFNKYGYLIAIMASAEDYVIIDRDDSFHIQSIYDKAGNAITFSYDDTFLKQITDTRGAVVKYSYNSIGWLTTATFSDGKILTFDYYGILCISKITSSADDSVTDSSSDFSVATFDFTSETHPKLTSVWLTSKKIAIAHNVVTKDEESVTLATRTISYGVTDEDDPMTTVTDEKNNRTRYTFNDQGDVVEYLREENGVVVDAKQMEYQYSNIGTIVGSNDATPYVIVSKTTNYADENTLYNKPIEEYLESYGSTIILNKQVIESFNDSHQPTEETITWSHTKDGTLFTYTQQNTYTYNESNQLTKEKREVSYQRNDANSIVTYPTAITNYFYNAQGKRIRTESYLEGKEDSLGKTIEETVYDENGHAVKSFSYNSLDPSSKFYTESETDEDGKTVADIDATGKHKTAYTYENGLLASETYPNGGMLSYSYDKAGNVNAITSSTPDGEANTNTVLTTAGEVTKLVSGNNTVNYAYDTKRRLSSVKLNNKNHVSYTYEDGVSDGEDTVDKVTTTYANGYSSTATYDKWGRLTKTAQGDIALSEIEYHADGKVETKQDMVNNVTHSYEYNNLNQLKTYTVGTLSEEFEYNVDGNCTSRTVNLPDYWESFTQDFTYDSTTKELTQTKITLNENEHFFSVPKTDVQKRTTGKALTYGNTKLSEESISYVKHGNHATMLPQSVRYAYGSNYGWKDKISYTYDCMGNISAIYEDDELVCRYEYDSLNRLTREDNKAFAKTVLFAYDENGNITSKRTYAYSPRKTLDELAELNCTKAKYTYDGDKLMSFDGETFAYDNLGNPTTYHGKTLVWEKGRQLKKYGTVTFAYDSFGTRTNVNGYSIDYDHSGNVLFTEGLLLFRDHTGVCGFKYLGNYERYVYQKDALGNIRGILDSTGNLVVKYTYDAFGNCKVLDASGNEIAEDYMDESGMPHIGHVNPFRYRGYYYDKATGLYFLESRFYDPETGRFINADTVEYLDPKAINGLNLYAYCGNNPVMNVDPSGHLPHIVIALLIVAAVLIVAGGIWGGTSAAMAGGDTLDILAGIGKGMMIGAILGAGVALTVGSFYVSGGATGVLGAIMLPYGTSLLFNVAEISGFQAHKSSARGSGFWQTSNDIVNAVFANTARIFFGVDSFLDGFIIGGKVFTNAPTFSKYTDELIELSSSWKFSRAAAIATNSILAAPASLISKVLMTFEILKQAKLAVFAIAGISDPDESGWILY